MNTNEINEIKNITESINEDQEPAYRTPAFADGNGMDDLDIEHEMTYGLGIEECATPEEAVEYAARCIRLAFTEAAEILREDVGESIEELAHPAIHLTAEEILQYENLIVKDTMEISEKRTGKLARILELLRVRLNELGFNTDASILNRVEQMRLAAVDEPRIAEMPEDYRYFRK